MFRCTEKWMTDLLIILLSGNKSKLSGSYWWWLVCLDFGKPWLTSEFLKKRSDCSLVSIWKPTRARWACIFCKTPAHRCRQPSGISVVQGSALSRGLGWAKLFWAELSRALVAAWWRLGPGLKILKAQAEPSGRGFSATFQSNIDCRFYIAKYSVHIFLRDSGINVLLMLTGTVAVPANVPASCNPNTRNTAQSLVIPRQETQLCTLRARAEDSYRETWWILWKDDQLTCIHRGHA